MLCRGFLSWKACLYTSRCHRVVIPWENFGQCFPWEPTFLRICCHLSDIAQHVDFDEKEAWCFMCISTRSSLECPNLTQSLILILMSIEVLLETGPVYEYWSPQEHLTRNHLPQPEFWHHEQDSQICQFWVKFHSDSQAYKIDWHGRDLGLKCHLWLL